MTSYQDFAARVGNTFSARPQAGAAFELELTDCAETGPNGFSLTFKAGVQAPIEQATYLLSADGFDPQPVFLVPVRPLADGVEYQAVFNRLPD